MENISLIANSGIQFYKFDIHINPNDDVTKTMGFYEAYESASGVRLKPARYLPDQDFWVEKEILAYQGYIDDQDKLLMDNINIQEIKGFALSDDGLQKDGMGYFYPFGDISDSLECYASREEENVWLPIPYFKKKDDKNNFGPIAWARAIIQNKSKKSDKVKTYRVILAFDTKLEDQNGVYYAPTKEDTYEGDNVFILSGDENYNLNFCDADKNCAWVEKYLKQIYLQREEKKEPADFPFFKHVALYQYLIKYLADGQFFPSVLLYSDEQSSVDVDLVLDIGNANTCGILFESPVSKDEPFEFTSVKKLILNDLSQIDKSYDEPFSMRLAFAESKFGEIQVEGYKNFHWASLLRLGEEASRLISKHNLDIDKGKETATHHSSPKRYLWDNKKSDVQWEFVDIDGSQGRKSIYYEGISEQFKANGEYDYEAGIDIDTRYSKKSLMTFVYIEIFLHAITQINSHEFRRTHGNAEKPRKLRRITITCPTSIIQYEQITLRKCAEDAVRALSRFFSDSFLGVYEVDSSHSNSNMIEIIPSPKDLSKKLNMAKEKKDWIYDEATCGQFVFLYAEIAQRYLGNVDLFFNIYAKKRDDVIEPEKKALTIGSIDIGGGTTDLMICAYQYEEGQSLAVLKPQPLYWESFNLAGDELLKDLIQQIILEGKPNSENSYETGATGVIENAARAKGVANVSEKLLNFFGTDANQQDYMARIFRKNFIVQVAVPIAIQYIKHAADPNSKDREVSYDDLFPVNKPNAELIQYFNQKFAPLNFEEITWKLSKQKVFDIVEKTFDPMLRQLSTIMHAYGCDFVLLAGKPTNIPKIREMIVRYYPVSPERIITLNNYRVGRWYPFANDLGYFEDTKTIVAVGASIALMGGLIDKLEGFRIKTDFLKRNLVATSDYMGTIDKYTQNIQTIYLNPDENTVEIEVHSLPMHLGYKQLPNEKYMGRPIYKIEFNQEYLEDKVLQQDSTLEGKEHEIESAMEVQKRNLKNRMPFKVKLKRIWSESKEQINIESIKDNDRNEISRKTLNLQYMTLPDERGYWLDTGEFILNIKS